VRHFAAVVTALTLAAAASGASGGAPPGPQLLALRVDNGGHPYAGDRPLLTTATPNGDGYRDKARVSFVLPRAATVKLEADLTYRKLDGGKEMKIDIAYPDGKGPYPAVLCVHGGAWRADLAANYAYAAEMVVKARAHHVVLDFNNVIETNGDLMPMAQQARNAVAWVYKNAQSFGGDPDRIYVSGHSSGGHLAGVTAHTLRSIVAAGADRNVTTRRLSGMGAACVSVVAPSVIVTQLDLRPTEGGGEKAPLIPRPKLSAN